ncbi:MAG: FkbM family methyltransferase [Candidatus Marsarchaeota archaeon]|nr:FkbM family methyltransferase [Candidatus Marsarchaeota archaeon]
MKKYTKWVRYVLGVIKTNALLNFANFYYRNMKQINRVIYFMYLSEKFKNKFKMQYELNLNSGVLETQEGIKIDFQTIDPIIFFETYCFRIHDEPEIYEVGKTMLDVGANVGDTALLYASKGCEVYSLEPNPKYYSKMLKNIDLNPSLKNKIIPIKAAIGKDINSEEYGGYISYTISNFLKQQKLESVDYLKVDIKPNEKYITVEDLKKVKNALAIEYANEDEKELKELIVKIKKAGFEKIRTFQHSTDSKADIKKVGIVVGYRLYQKNE